MNTQVEILVLDDYRPGNTNQSIALAKELNLNYKVESLKYNYLSYLPNNFLTILPLHTSLKNLQSISNNYNAKLIISAGRRNAATANYLKNTFFPNAKLIQIMSPHITHCQQFDLIILPTHDLIQIKEAKISKIIGALGDINLKSNFESFIKFYPKAKKFITVLIGGNTKNYKLTESNCQKFCNLLNQLYLSHNIPFFINFSRRTSNILKKIFLQNLAQDHFIYDPADGGYNPYIESILKADYVIVTGDSISMCSEVATTGKPLYIYLFEGFQSKKHRFFIQQLVDLKIARYLNNTIIHLEYYTYNPLTEVKRIANIIKSEIL